MVQNCEWVSQYAMSMLSSQSMNSATTRRGMLATLPGPWSGRPNPWPGYVAFPAADGAVSCAVPAAVPAGPVLAGPVLAGAVPAAAGVGRPDAPDRAGAGPRRLRGFL